MINLAISTDAGGMPMTYCVVSIMKLKKMCGREETKVMAHHGGATSS